MKENATASVLLLLNIAFIICVPLLYVNGLIEGSLLETVNNDNSIKGDFAFFIFLFLPLIYIGGLALYLAENPRIYQYFSFKHLKRGRSLKNTDFFYKQLFLFLQDVIDNQYYKKSNKSYIIKKSKDEEFITIDYYEPLLKQNLQWVLFDDSFGVETVKERKQYSPSMEAKQQDVAIYLTYFETLRAYFAQFEQKEDERVEMEQKNIEEQKLKKENKLKVQEKRYVEKMFEEVAQMKRKKMQNRTITYGECDYEISLEKQNIEVKRNGREVFLKCVKIQDTPVVYYINENKFLENKDYSVALYTEYLTKETKENVR